MQATKRLVIVFLGLLVAAAGLSLAAPAASAGSYLPTEESKVIEKVNATRASKGLGRLAKQDGLVGMARRQADRMAAKGTIFHNTDLGGEISALGVQWLRVGENVGMGPNIDLIYAALLESPKHYENIVRSDYNTIGLGVVSKDGQRFLVQVFANITGAKAASAPVAAAPKPAPATKAPVAVAPAVVAPVAAKAPAPAPTVRPTPRPSVLPNALTGGYVREITLPQARTPSDQAKRTQAASDGPRDGFGHLIDILAFWS